MELGGMESPSYQASIMPQMLPQNRIAKKMLNLDFIDKLF